MSRTRDENWWLGTDSGPQLGSVWPKEIFKIDFELEYL